MITEEAVDSNCSVAKTMPETLALIGFVAVDNPKCSYGGITEEAVDSNCSVAKTMPETLALIGFVAVDNPKCSYGFPAEDLVYEKAIAECCVIKESGSLNGGILLKCVDKQLVECIWNGWLTPNTFSSIIQTPFDEVYNAQLNDEGYIGPYEEIYSIQKTSTASIDPRLPLNRHAGYIVIGFKLLDDSSKQQTLEKSWLSWSGAREIYKYSPRTWNLRRISLQKYKPMGRISSQLFAYILMCEFGSILHPSNTIQALDMCERLRVRNCGHIALYQVHTTYCSTTSNAKKMPTSSSATMKRQTMMRGFSQDVEAIPPECTADRRNRLRQSRDHSFQHPCSNFNSYQY
ncbi:hypothetical protein DICVIV_03883 [Dictyocaulus viviparus]|uniref:DUF7153 domain-containing protein n=1 Tax=Dictyocaulus viviparus TaxID=29172 RepID=A0A0D8Y5U0_DICVI|nr:hypothetical protein DICVIV_03883 [Dictyocaulus viviparus]